MLDDDANDEAWGLALRRKAFRKRGTGYADSRCGWFDAPSSSSCYRKLWWESVKTCTHRLRWIRQTFITHNADEVLLLGVSQHVFLQVLFLFKRRIASFMIAFERAILAMDVLDVNLQLCARCESWRTLIAVIVLDLEVALQMLLDVLLLERSESTYVALEAFLLQMHPLIMTTQVRC